MTEPDFSGVDAVRRAEMRRRIGLVREYLAGPRTAERRERAAEELGLSPGQFLRVARIWRETGSPDRLQGAGALAPARQRIDADTEALINEVIDDVGLDARFVDLLNDVRHRARERGLAEPAQSTIYRRLNARRRASAAATEDRPSITVAHCSIGIPVTDGASVSRPEALLAVLMPEGIVVAAETAMPGKGAPDLGRLVRRLKRLVRPCAPERPLLLQHSLVDVEGNALDIEGVPARRVRGANAILSRVFGQRLGDLAIGSATRSNRPVRRRAETRLNAPLSRIEAADVLIRAIERHNDGREAPRPAGFSFAALNPVSVG